MASGQMIADEGRTYDRTVLHVEKLKKALADRAVPHMSQSQICKPIDTQSTGMFEGWGHCPREFTGISFPNPITRPAAQQRCRAKIASPKAGEANTVAPGPNANHLMATG